MGQSCFVLSVALVDLHFPIHGIGFHCQYRQPYICFLKRPEKHANTLFQACILDTHSVHFSEIVLGFYKTSF